ncbi:lytic murein transglycosylase [Vibrio sp. VPAP30]|nr:lytic murein transglycosylase [Vibrio sp. VPAP30]
MEKVLAQLRWLIGLTLISLTLMNPVTVLATSHPVDLEQELSLLSPYKQQIQARLNANQALIQDISHQLESQKLPKLLVLLPMLESSYNPNAVSGANAAGLWQLIPATAKRFGLNVSQNNDQRFDPAASTDAAINYLSFLYSKFGDLTLTLAAYNAGEGRVARAIQRAGSQHYSHLTLPAETSQYVNRFYALLELVELNHLTNDSNHRLFLFGLKHATPLIDLHPLPPLIEL